MYTTQHAGTPGVKKFKPRPFGRTGNHERKPVPIFTNEERKKLITNTRQGFVDAVIKCFNSESMKPEDIVDEARVYFRQRYDAAIKRGITRPSHWLNSASTALTEIKAELKAKNLAVYAFRRELALTKAELLKLDRLNHRRLEQKIHQSPEINMTTLIYKLYELLNSEDPAEIALGIAGLTGRRQTEITHSILLAKPHNGMRHRYPSFWAHVTGFSKKRQQDKYAVRARELPLLAPREALVAALRELRDQWPSDSHAEASQLYAKKLAIAHKKHLRPLGVQRMHDLRKTFVQLAYLHFNERGSVLPAFASRSLGHKRPLSKRIMTYLIIRTTDMPDLKTIFALAKVDLHPEKAEDHDVLVKSVHAAPQFSTPPDSSDEDMPDVDVASDSDEGMPDVASMSLDTYSVDRKERTGRLRTIDEVQGAMDALTF